MLCVCGGSIFAGAAGISEALNSLVNCASWQLTSECILVVWDIVFLMKELDDFPHILLVQMILRSSSPTQICLFSLSYLRI